MEKVLKLLIFTLTPTFFFFLNANVFAQNTTPDSLRQTELGLIFGNSTNSRQGKLNNVYGSFTRSNSQNNGKIGLQAKFLFNACKLNSFFLLNVENNNIFNSSNSLITNASQQSPLRKFDRGRLAINNHWTTRFLVGLESEPFYRVTVGIGAGVALVNQEIELCLHNCTVSAKNTNNSISPSILTSMTWHLRPTVSNHATSIALQIAADYYKAMTVRINHEHASIAANWQLSEMLVFNVVL